MSDLANAVAKLKDLEAKVVTRALEDDAFRSKLLKNPKAAVAELAGKALPDGLLVKAQEEAPNTLTIILPKSPSKAKAGGKLSDAALDKVAGGGGIFDCIGSVIADFV